MTLNRHIEELRLNAWPPLATLLIVVGRQQLGFVFDHVIAKYGRNFVQLYE